MRLDNILGVWEDIDASYKKWNEKKTTEPVTYIKKLICYRNRACQLGEIRNLLGAEIKTYTEDQVAVYNGLIESFKQLEEFFNSCSDEELEGLAPSEILVNVTKYFNPGAVTQNNVATELELDEFAWQKDAAISLGEALKTGIINTTTREENNKIVTYVVKNNIENYYYKTNDEMSFVLLYNKLQAKAETHFDKVCKAILAKIVSTGDRSVVSKTLVFVHPDRFSMGNGSIKVDNFSVNASQKDRCTATDNNVEFNYYKFILQDCNKKPIDVYFVE